MLKTENNKKKKISVIIHFLNYCSFALMHYSCPMNSARGANHQKKKVKCRMQNVDVDMESKCSLKQCLDSGNVFAFGFYIYIYIYITEKRSITFVSARDPLPLVQQNKRWTVLCSGSRALFTGPTNLFFHTNFH